MVETETAPADYVDFYRGKKRAFREEIATFLANDETADRDLAMIRAHDLFKERKVTPCGTEPRYYRSSFGCRIAATGRTVVFYHDSKINRVRHRSLFDPANGVTELRLRGQSSVGKWGAETTI